VCKPLFGSQGNGLIRMAGPEDLPEASAVNGVWYLQRFLETAETGATDWRVFVIGGRVVAAMRRSTPGWLTNVAQGGRCQAALPDRAVRAMAERAAEVLGMGYAGIDLMQDRQGRWWVLEVNSIPAWRGLQAVTGVNIAGLLVEDLLRRCAGGGSREAV
jgi:RimK family alpha-L-glutamate ligase